MYTLHMENIPVCHYDHVVCSSSEGVDDHGVAGDHDNAGDDEGDDQLVPGEIDANIVISVIAVDNSLNMGAVGIVIYKNILK